MHRTKLWMAGIALGAVAGGLALGWATGTAPVTGPLNPERVIHMAAVEYKGPELEVYRWDPGLVVAYSGDEVLLRITGIHGHEHHAAVEGHAGHFIVRRGRTVEVRFRAGKPGLYRVVCQTHQPIMTGYLLVLPRPG